MNHNNQFHFTKHDRNHITADRPSGAALLRSSELVPAIFALTKEPLVVFTSNIFAILDLRSTSFMLSGAIDKSHYLKFGLSVVLIFVGTNTAFLDDLFDGKFPMVYSLGIIAGVIALAAASSLAFPKAADKH